jgi:hypothetical protein
MSRGRCAPFRGTGREAKLVRRCPAARELLSIWASLPSFLPWQKMATIPIVTAAAPATAMMMGSTDSPPSSCPSTCTSVYAPPAADVPAREGDASCRVAKLQAAKRSRHCRPHRTTAGDSPPRSKMHLTADQAANAETPKNRH